MESIVVIVVSWLLAGAAFGLGLEARRVARAVAAWPSVPGTLLSREVVRSSVASPSSPGTRYTAAVRYTYVVDGTAYTGDRILAYGTVSGTRENVQRIVDALADRPEVRYDPTDPAKACLQPQPAWWAPGLFGAAAFAFLVGLATLITVLAGR